MNSTNRKATAALPSLQEAIDQAVGLQNQVDELCQRLSALRAEIKHAMEELGVERQLTASGNESLLIPKTAFIWNRDKLEKVLDAEAFEHLVPRKPEGDKLRQLLDASPADFARQLRGCKKDRQTLALELRTAPAAPPEPGV
jgi:regulator of replication initiation timing